MVRALADLDTLVIDDPGVSRPVVVRTRADGALTMQVMTLGEWHRRTPDLSHTACGVPIPTQYSPLRREALTEPLCSECFTKFELSRAAERAKREQDLDR